MPKSSFHDYVMTDLFGGFPDMISRAMFGGYGIYQAGLMFALIAEDQLYFKLSDANRAQYEAYHSQPFIYTDGHKSIQMSYWLVPEEVMDNHQELGEWIAQSVQVARLAKQSKSTSKRKS